MIQFNRPMSLADYDQKTGRAGRDGQHTRSILLFSPDDCSTDPYLLGDMENPSAQKRAAASRLCWTGSNAYRLFTEFSALLSGRYVEIMKTTGQTSGFH